MSILLTPEEILEAYHGRVSDIREVAKAQLKKVVEWLHEECFDHPYESELPSEEYNRKRYRCFECWQALLKEIE